MAASADNKLLSDLFDTAAKILDLKGANRFKAIAFQRVSDLLDNMSEDVRAVWQAGGLEGVEKIKGIGESSAKMIADWLATGRSVDYDELAASVPEGLLDMLRIPGLGPKTVRLFWQERELTSVDALAKAVADGTLDGLKGIGAKKIEQIKQGIDLLAAAGQRRSLGTARAVADGIIEQLLATAGVATAEACGSLRRGKETIGDIDLLVTVKKGTEPGGVLEQFSKFPQFARVLGLGETKSSVVTHDGLQVDCRLVPPANLGAALLYFTGSKQHNIRLRTMAQDRGHTLNEWGVFDQKQWEAQSRKPGETPSLKPVAGKTEAEVYAWLDMDPLPPEMREDTGEIELALKRAVPQLVALDDYRGDLHTHTKASDGIGTIEEMAEAAKARGYKFLAITDHSKAQIQAGGLDAKRLMKHVEAIRKANDAIKGIELLAGSEVDILADGSLDYDDDVLAELDWVVASPHIALRQDTAKATARILRAIDNPYVNVIGHPTGRLVNARAGLPLDFPPIFKAAAANGTAMEINADYHRLDLNDAHARQAIEAGCLLCIDTDAHSPQGLGNLAGGIATARRAWAQPKHVVNCMTLAQLKKFAARKRP